MKFLSSHRFRIGAAAMAAHMLIAACVPPAFAQEGAPKPNKREPVTLNFSNAEIESIARTMAVVSGQDIVVDPRVKGTMTLITDRPVTPSAALNQFAAALRLQNYAIVEADGLYKIVPEAEAKLQTNAVSTSVGALRGNQVVTQVFKLNHESAASLLPVLRPLIAPNNTINVSGNNSLVITDYAENMRRIARIVAALDVPNASDVEVIPLRHSIASDLAPLVARLIEGGSGNIVPGMPGQPDAAFKTAILPDPRSNSLILRAANPARVQLVRSLVEKLDRPPINAGNGEAGNVYVVYLKNADAVKLATTLRAAIASDGGRGGSGGATPGFTPQPMQAANPSGSGMSPQATAPVNNANQPSTGGQIQADPSTNSLIITASEPQYRQIRAVIDKLDSRRAQVMIEALIVEVNATKAANFGVQWQAALGGNAAIGTNSSLTGPNILALSAALATGTLTGLPQLASGLNFGIAGKIGGQNVLGLIANFFSSDGDANILSTPNLLTLDNEEAKIVIGQNVPFPTGSYANTTGAAGVNPFTTVERKDVGLTLRVRPQINENGTVKMTIYQEISNVVEGSTSNPNGLTTNKRALESNVLVEDGGLIMLGGLLSDDYGTSTDKIPVMGDIPLIGNLFKSEKRKRVKSNLMMFLHPVVMRDAASAETFAYDRYDELRGLQQRMQPDTANVMLRNVDGAPVLPELPPASTASNERRQMPRFQGTALIPPPRPAPSPALTPSPLRGALPPTGDPSSARESP